MIRASALAGLSTVPPYMPECRSTGDSTTSICAYMIPRRPDRDRRDVALEVARVADHGDVRGQAVPVRLDPAVQAVGAVLLLALEHERQVDRGRQAGRPQRLEGREVHHELALVVGHAPPDEPAVPQERLERRRLPQLERVHRLHVVVAVDQHDRGARRLVDPRRRRSGAAPSAATSTSVAPTRRSRSATHSAAVTMSAACSGSAEMLGMRANSSSGLGPGVRATPRARPRRRDRSGSTSGAGLSSVIGSPWLGRARRS